ncbi:MAG TPA: response regulator transcription factor [Sediminibacterium sp.]|jgi:DNA-binding response OmpR family regulator|uniref:response regulator transcription factor n=1 Tax=Sediminibacterium sp. TaxID=1917865 RepID=UPI0008C1CF6B|nr:response regulator transcription factor [Sediminibacterium sp.]OHC85717.1 MAG: DNA-binding response regulator [Sphingobacteriia bacterium RIFOXYC2_FULL_35_18]OHC87253.1 MAG: DNA-binding response regulator [Sphingobacteriia bacterium RIFOXYD2_FULL_35_12]OYY10234.1 MAG: DNA-binding response regulator [Sphingobacteriia bacterium 35-36-14]OYZ52882.1 MAG: DNA-binding response regulator [Sphingobacteriia bacterium 24-36-13]OZA64540.1 MAG: DNA-binding response regulator [Sphingobacteriia bacterium
MEKKYKILLAEDEAKLAKAIQEELTRVGYEVDVAENGLQADRMFMENDYSMALLDINLPGKTGMALCNDFRKRSANIPIVMLTAVGEIHDKVAAFNIGADDYLVKPFHFDELFARLKVLFKRTDSVEKHEKLIYADLEIDFKLKSVSRSGININLTSKEFTLLTLLVRTPERVISKQEILEKVWDLSFDTGTNTIEVYISFLRNKIDKPFSTKLIHTKPGFGYFIK